MMNRFVLGIGAAAVLAVLSALFRHVDLLRTRLDASSAELSTARLDVARLLDESRKDLDARLTRDVAGMHRDILGPSLQVSVRGGVGGGTLLSTAAGRSWAITAWHVVQKAGDAREAVEVKLYDASGAPAETFEADVAAWDAAKDLALLRLRTSRRLGPPARLASRETMKAIRVFTPLYAVGCPLGHDPLPTRGEVATLSKDVGTERFWMMNAPTIYGNSGGGIFHSETHELIGVSVMICTYDGAVSVPVPHLGILAPLSTVYDWLDSLGYTHAYDPEASVEACEAERAAEVFRAPAPGAANPGAATTSSR